MLVWVTGAGFSWVVLKFWFALALAWFFSRGWFSLLSFFGGPGGFDCGVRLQASSGTVLLGSGLATTASLLCPGVGSSRMQG